LTRDRVMYWAQIIGVGPTSTYRIPRKEMVTNSYNRNYRFCGLCRETKTIIYQGKLKEEDIIHELLHFKFPKISHSNVRTITNILLRILEE